MARQALEDALRRVPFLEALGVSVEEARPGAVVLRLPSSRQNQDLEGAVHAGALFTLGGLAASVALLTHPRLSHLEPLRRGATVTWLRTSTQDVTAHAEVTPERVDAILSALEGADPPPLALSVPLRDGQGEEVAAVETVFGFRTR